MELRDATPGEIEGVLERTHALWSDGLGMSEYQDFIRTLMASEWAAGGGPIGPASTDGGARNYRFLVLVDGPEGKVLAGVKLYRFAARLDEEVIPVGGIGAVFTPPELRRHGYAAEMIARTHTIMAERGDGLSLLFSEIGEAYYRKLGYRTMEPHTVRLAVPPVGPPPPRGLTRMHRTGLDTVIRLREREDAGAAFALVRDLPYWKHLLARASYPTLSLGREKWESRLMVAGSGGYLWSMFGPAHEGAAAKLLEFGESQPGSALRALLDEFFEECRRRGIEEVDAWLPPALAARDPRLSGAGARPLSPPPVVPMWLPLDRQAEADMTRHAGSALLHLTDVF